MNPKIGQETQNEKTNIVLIGMPGAGKSTLGQELAARLGLPFVDTDDLISEASGISLQDLIDRDGATAFMELEASLVSALNLDRSIIATGGSVVYSDEAMGRLKDKGTLIYLRIGLDELNKRAENFDSRGIVLRGGSSMDLGELIRERTPLYERYADRIVDIDGLDVSQAVDLVLASLEG